MAKREPSSGLEAHSPTDWVIRFFLEQKLLVWLFMAGIVLGGLIVAPFDWDLGGLPRFPIAVDAIPDIGENQQIVFTEWEGRSPQDVEDQITYPMTVALLGIPGVRTIRSYSYFGFSSVFIIFEENIEFYWSRTRILEKLNSLPPGTLPEATRPALGPDATGLGQVYWYTLEGRDPDGKPVGGWDLNELRTVQDWQVRYALLSSGGVSEVASIGGFVQEYQIDVDPDAMRVFKVTLEDVMNAVRQSNVDVGARTMEVNKVEYIIRGRGFIKNLDDIGDIIVAVNENVPITVKNIAAVSRGPALRRGVLDKAGAEAVGGVTIVRFGANPLEVINRVKSKIQEIAPGLPTRAVIDESRISRDEAAAFARGQGFEAWDGPSANHTAWLTWLRAHPRAEWPPWVTTSQITIVPFYDRTGLIYETLGTLNSALVEQILITALVVVVMLVHVRTSLIIGLVLPLSVLLTFMAMKAFGVDANIVALSGIAIAIGTVVDMGIIVSENVLKHLNAAPAGQPRIVSVYRGASEVGSAVLTAVSTTIVGFMPVFAMTGSEGKLFRPLAFTKTFALGSSIVIALLVMPALIHLFVRRTDNARTKWLIGVPASTAVAILGAIYLANEWHPLGVGIGLLRQTAFVGIVMGGLLLFFRLFIVTYASVLRLMLAYKVIYLILPVAIMVFGFSSWRGFNWTFSAVPKVLASAGIDESAVRNTQFWTEAVQALPGIGNEFMPDLDEGSFLFMPFLMPHASLEETANVLQFQDKAIHAIPEVESVVGKIGRAETAIDPGELQMMETVVNYRPEYITNEAGRRVTFRYDRAAGQFARDASGELVPDPRGKPFRQWRDHIHSPDDIWREIVAAAAIPGTTSSPKLQPIKTRLIMLQSGMRAPMGVKIKGPDQETIEALGLKIQALLKDVPGVSAQSVQADRVVGKPYFEIEIKRDVIARYGLKIRDVQDVIEAAIGGMTVTTTVEGRERYAVRIRYLRELRDNFDALEHIVVPTMEGAQIPLTQLAEFEFVRGPQMIKSEDTFLVGYVLFDKNPGFAEVDVVTACQTYLKAKIADGGLVIPAGVSYTFAGNYENQLHAARTLNLVLPISLGVIFLILYFQFRRTSVALIVFGSILLAWSGGFLMLWLYGQPGFLNVELLGVNLRDLFHIHPINLSVAVWVGFLALFGIASDDAVVIATYIGQSLERLRPNTIAAVREAVVVAGERRIRPCLMTAATTILALLPVMSSTGRGSDIMGPMSIPIFGGMVIVLVTLFLVPVLYCAVEEFRVRWGKRPEDESHQVGAP